MLVVAQCDTDNTTILITVPHCKGVMSNCQIVKLSNCQVVKLQHLNRINNSIIIIFNLVYQALKSARALFQLLNLLKRLLVKLS